MPELPYRMTRVQNVLICLAIFPYLAFTQSAEIPARFEIADVHLSPKSRNPYLRGPYIRNGNYQIRTATMVDLIGVAWNVDANNIVGGPSWLEIPYYDVIAKAPPNTTANALRPLLQALLEDRFELVVHRDTWPIPALALTAGKHPSLKTSDSSAPAGCQFNRPQPDPLPGLRVFSFACRNMTMAAFVDALQYNMPGTAMYLNDLPVADQTGLTGAFDFSLHFTSATGDEPITLFEAVDKQLGLKLEPANVPFPVIVVDSVNQKPTDNLPGVTEALHTALPPVEFEVADIKPSPPDTRRARYQYQPGGRVHITGVTLRSLIRQAWDINDAMLIGAPKWLGAERFDILAKAAAPDGESVAEVDSDSVWPLIRKLLADRFRLAVHNEERRVQAYTLTASRPKLVKAAPASRTRCSDTPPGTQTGDAKDPRILIPARSELVACQNVAMAEFAEQLPDLAPGYFHSPVLDRTGLEGGWDFTLNFSPAGMFQGIVRGVGRGGESRQSNDSPEPPDPNGAISLFEAVEKQLGLKLAAEKRIVPVPVIDHIEPEPTDN